MFSSLATRRKFVLRSALASGAGLAGAPLLAQAMNAQTTPPSAGTGAIRRLGYDGQPSTDPVPPVVIHNGFIYIAAGANDSGTPIDSSDIAVHVQRTMDNVKKLLESAGGDMNNILTLTVYIATLEFYQPMNKAYYAYFAPPNHPPARCTISVTGIPLRSLFEISCIAAVTH